MKNNRFSKFKEMDRRAVCRSILLVAVFITSCLLCSCTRYEPSLTNESYLAQATSEDFTETEAFTEETLPETEAETEPIEEPDMRTPVKVKALYLASKPVGNHERMQELMKIYDETELNAVVIDIKDDYGKITYSMENVPSVVELESIESCIDNLPQLLAEFKSHNIYCIARIVTMRDPHLARVKPEWMLTKQDGTVYKDNSGYAWVNPYKEEYWVYLRDIALECGRIGFQEIQFDYFRFCTDKGADDCIFNEDDVKDRDKISVITELAQYMAAELKKNGLYMSCDVFGTIIRSKIDSRAVGQDYVGLASIIDYICPMVYPSHYANESFGLDYPDLYPYEAIRGALKRSKTALSQVEEGTHLAIVRPWLQAFTATWLGKGKYRTYGAEEIRLQIQATYDSGYDEWILWSPSVTYDYSAFLSKEEAKAEEEYIAESRANIPEEEKETEAAETFPIELKEALDGDELYKEDESLLLEDGPIITYEENG